MPMTFDTASQEDMETKDTNRLETDGIYHFSVDHVNEQPTGKGSAAIDGFQVELSVLTEGPEHGKTIKLTFFNTKQSNSEKANKWARSKITAFLESTCLTHESQRGQSVSVELSDAVGRQVIANVEHGQNEDGTPKKFMDLAYANMYHVDDPNQRAAKCSKNAKALALLPKNLRRDPASFANATTGSAASSGGGSGSNGTSTTNTTRNISDDLGDL